jgi:predicted TIM-barrel fold metal-dependent hydrolase
VVKTVFLSLTIVLISARLPAQPVSQPKAIAYRTVDCHLHLVDFLQRTEGIKAVLAAMDRSGVDQAMICGMPLVKKWSVSEPEQPQYYLDDDARCYWYSATDVLVARQIETLSAADRARFHPFICGFNGSDRNAIDHVKRMLEWYPGLWEGIGEVMTRHDDLTALTYGDVAQANSVSLDPIYDLAAENDMPVSVHSDVSSVWKRAPLYLGEIEGAVKKHPRTRIIWCHAGISRRIEVPTLTKELRRMLAAYPNLYIDLSWVVFETYLTKSGQPVKDWVDLIESFPDRFMIGSDKVGKFGNYHEEMQKYYVLLEALKPETARRVGHDNFLSVLSNRKKL